LPDGSQFSLQQPYVPVPKAAKSRAPNIYFRELIQADLAVQLLRLNISTSVFQKYMIDYCRPVTDEGRFAIVTSVDAGCGGRG
jgi:hypothetical protein